MGRGGVSIVAKSSGAQSEVTLYIRWFCLYVGCDQSTLHLGACRLGLRAQTAHLQLDIHGGARVTVRVSTPL